METTHMLPSVFEKGKPKLGNCRTATRQRRSTNKTSQRDLAEASKRHPKARKIQERARSRTGSPKKPAPKNNQENKEKRAQARAMKREEEALRKASRKKGTGDHSNPVKAPSKGRPSDTGTSTEDFKRSQERLAKMIDEALEEIVRPSSRDIAQAALSTIYERAADERREAEVTDSLGTRRPLTPSILESMFYDGEGSPYTVRPTRKDALAATESLLIDNNPDMDLPAPVPPVKPGRDPLPLSFELADRLLSSSRMRSVREAFADIFSLGKWIGILSQRGDCEYAVPLARALEAAASAETRAYRPPKMERRFIIDVGPTNSGKTYSGMEDLAEAESGVYLGPLRLLAMEAADDLSSRGCPCSLLTGEERRDVDGARHVASTVEMLDVDAIYDVAVIDECQMITDPERGHAWARAIACVRASVVRLCTAPEALPLICSILDGTGEEYEVEEHDRLVPLSLLPAPVRFPAGVERGDAIVSFSRKGALALARQLVDAGIAASIVYGALPYPVRREEVRKFADGETQVVVATDAIGMGLNLPVHRVLFAETEKFDGAQVRALLASEVRQIAGRAGRYGRYDHGWAGVLAGRGCDRRLVESSLEGEPVPVPVIRADMPEALRGEVPGAHVPLCAIMRAWEMTEVSPPYVKRDLSQQVALARRVDDLDNAFVSCAVEIPFKSGDRFCPLDDVWEDAVRRAYRGEPFAAELYGLDGELSLEYLEDAAKIDDLMYGLAKRYGGACDLEEIDRHRALVAQKMIELLARGDANKKKGRDEGPASERKSKDESGTAKELDGKNEKDLVGTSGDGTQGSRFKRRRGNIVKVSRAVCKRAS